MQIPAGRWILGVVYIVAVAAIWIAASYVVQSVVDAGVSPFLVTYICNSLFVLYIPLVEISRLWDDLLKDHLFKRSIKASDDKDLGDSEKTVLLEGSISSSRKNHSDSCGSDGGEVNLHGKHTESKADSVLHELAGQATCSLSGINNKSITINEGLDSKRRWTRVRIAKVSLLISPFWFLAQLTFNLSLKYTTVTSNTILSSASSIFTFLVSLAFLDEKFTWLKLFSILFCMGGTIIVSVADSKSGANAIASNPLLGDILAIVSAGFYAIYITLIRKKLPSEEKGDGCQVSMAQFLGFLGLFNFLIFLPVALILNFTKLEPFHRLTWEQCSLILGKGLFDNVLSDYLWAMAVLLTTTTIATAGLTIQVPMAAVMDFLTGHAPHFMDYLGAIAVIVGFVGITIPSDICSSGRDHNQHSEDSDVAIIS